MKTLHLVLIKNWYRLIQSGVKLEEYRNITPQYEARLVQKRLTGGKIVFIHYDTVTFTNGYKMEPRFEIECKGIHIGAGRPEWGAESGKEYFVISLGKIITDADRQRLAEYNNLIPF